MTTSTNKTNTAAIRLISFLVLYLALSIISVFIQNIIVDRPFHEQQVELHREVIAGTAPAPIQYRVFVYYIAEGLIRLGVDFSAAYWLIRCFFLFASAVLFHLYIRKWLDDAACFAGTLFMFAVMPLTYWGYFMQPTDPVNLFFFILAYWLIRDRKDVWIAPLLFIATFNREAPVILPLVFLFYRYDELQLKELAGKFILYSFAAAIVYFGLPKMFGIREIYDEIFVLWRNLKNYESFVYPALLFSVFLFLPWKNFAARPKFLRRSALIIPFFLVLHYLITLPRETRLFLPLFPIVIPMGLITLFGRKESAEPAIAVASPGWLQSAVIKNPKTFYIILFALFLIVFRIYYVYMEKTYMRDFYKNREIAVLMQKGEALMKEKNFAGARDTFEAVISKNPSNPGANLMLGIVYSYYIKDPGKAVFFFEQYLKLRPADPQAAKIRAEITRLKK